MKHKFTVDRGTWYRGKGSAESMLCRHNDLQKCCLGFLCVQLCRLDESEITGLGSPASTSTFGPEADAKLKELGLTKAMEPATQHHRDIGTTAACNALMRTNDCDAIDEAEREATLKAQFAALDIEVEFIN